MKKKPSIHLSIGALFCCIVLLTFWIRIQGVHRLPTGQFTENDAFFYQWLGDNIAEHGILPEKDMHRWLPRGRDNGLLLPLYSYAIAYIHKAVAWAFPALTGYHIQLYLSVFCFTLGLGVLFIFLARIYGLLFATVIGVLLATLPGSIERSAAGFGDRDAWCWMFGILAVISYLWKESMQPGRRRLVATLLSGFIVFLGGLSWEAFGLFVLIILCAEIWKFCTTDAEQHLKEYLIWILMFVPLLYFLAPVYRRGYSFWMHTAALTLVPPLVVFAIRGTRYLLLTYVEYLRPHAQKLAWGLTLGAVTLGIGYLFFQSSTFETTAFALQESRLMKDMTELVDPRFGYWTGRYGAVFILGSLGLIFACLHLWKRKGFPLALALILFTATTFFRWPLSSWIGEGGCNTLFFISLWLTIGGVAIACLRKENAKNELVTLAMLIWFLLWVALSRGGKRYDFFIGIPLAYGTAWILCVSPGHLLQKLKDAKILFSHVSERWVTVCFAIVVLIPVLFWNPLGGHANRAIAAAATWRKPIPGEGTPLAQTFEWMKSTLPQDAIVAANWSYGSRLNVLGKVKTITDQDTFLPHWIHLYYRHVYCAQSEREALEFLKTHGATHLMLREQGLTSRAYTYSYIGSDENSDRRFGLTRLVLQKNKFVSRTKDTSFQYINTINIKIENPPDFLTARLKKGGVARLPYVVFKDTKRHVYKTFSDRNPHGGVILYYDQNGSFEKTYHISTLGWQSLAVRLYFLGDLSDIFVPVYPEEGNDTTSVKVWKINYPLDIETNPTYLATEPEALHEK